MFSRIGKTGNSLATQSRLNFFLVEEILCGGVNSVRLPSEVKQITNPCKNTVTRTNNNRSNA